MSLAGGILSFVLAGLTGILLLFLIGPWRDSLCGPFLLKTSVATGLGIGVSSCLFFLWLLAAGSAGRGIAAADLLVVLALAGLAWPGARACGFRVFGGPKPERRGSSLPGGILAALFILLVIVTAGSLILLSMQRPHGGWDAWAIWNSRARFLYRGGPRWTDAFSPLLLEIHPDYPLLVPSFIARGWTYVGSDTVVVPIATAFLFAFATAGLLVSSLAGIRSRAHGLIAGIALLGTPLFASQGAGRYFQYMDIPLAFYFLAAIAFFVLQDLNPRVRAYSVLAGVSAGLACWTKNEGLLFLGVLAGSRFVSSLWFRQLGSWLRESARFMAGLAPVLAVVLYFKWKLAPPSDMVAEFDLRAAMARLADLDRYGVVAAAWAKELLFRFPAVPAILAIGLIGIGFRSGEKKALASSGITVAGMLMAYFFIYVITSKPLQWHLDTSLSRLLLQIFPSFLFVGSLLVSPIREEAGSEARPEKRDGRRRGKPRR